MLLGLVLLVQAIGTVFKGTKEIQKKQGGPKKEKRGSAMKAQILKNELKLEHLNKLNNFHAERTDALKTELQALEQSYEQLNDVVKERMAYFEHLELEKGVCHCNKCIERDTWCVATKEEERRKWMNRNQKFVLPQTEELWVK